MGDSSDHDEKSLGDKLKHPFRELKEKLHNTHLHDVKVNLIHKKHQIGKFGNLVGRPRAPLCPLPVFLTPAALVQSPASP